MGNEADKKTLEFYGGVPTLLASFATMFVGIIWLGLTGAASPQAFWPMVLLGILTGILLAKDKKLYVEAVVDGISSNMLAIMLLAWFLAGIMGRLMVAAGLIKGLIWGFLGIGISIAWLPLIAFFVSSLMSMSTGTSLGTLIAASPIILPVGYDLGGDPLLLAGAIIGGAFVGDNLAPISDTTIVSAYSQGTTVAKVVRTRIKYAAVAGVITVGTYLIFALLNGTDDSTVPAIAGLQPVGLVMLAVPILLIYLMFTGTHLVTALLYSNAAGFIVALLFKLITFSDILSIDRARVSSGGIITDGINDMVGVAIFSVFLMGMIGTMESSRFSGWLMIKAERIASTKRRAEILIVSATLFLNALTAAGTPVMVILGPFVRRLGHKFRIAPWRRGNLLDGCSTSIVGLLPWSVAILIPVALFGSATGHFDGSGFNPVRLVPFVFYCWALMFVMIIAAITGWGSESIDEEAYQKEMRQIYGSVSHRNVALSESKIEIG